MQFTIERAVLLRALGHVQSVVERRNTIPILNNVLLRASGSGLGLTATDLELSLSEQVAADVEVEGTITAPAHTLYDIVRKLPDGAQLRLEAAEASGQLALRSGRSRFDLSCLPAADFPAVSTDSHPHSFQLSADSARALIDHTRFAVSTEETRYYLNGIYLHAAERDGVPVLRAVATDGHRLARFDVPLPEGAAGIPGVIVPRKAVQEWRKLIDETEGDVAVGLSESRIQFAFDDAVLSSKLIDGTFPDYARVIPEGNALAMDIERRSFAEAVDRVSTISTEKSRAVKLGIREGALTLSATSLDQGRAEETVEARFSGESMDVGFNARYMLDIAERISGDRMRFRLKDAASAAIVEDIEDADALYVLMPMRV